MTEPNPQSPASAPGQDTPVTIPAESAVDPAAHRVDPRTGEPARPWTVTTAVIALFGAAGAVGVSIFWVYWDAVDRFATASWLMGQWETEPGSVWRVLLAVAVTLVAVLVGTVTSVVGYYAALGYRWTRIGGLVAAAISFASLTLNQAAWAAMPLAALGAALLWLPSNRRYVEAWARRRRPEPLYAPPIGDVFYGPLPRYR